MTGKKGIQVLGFVVFLLSQASPSMAEEYAHAWAKRLGGVGSDSGRSVAVDKEGHVFITGGFTGTADFDPGEETYPLTAAGEMDVFLSKLDAEGNFIWAKRWGGNSYNFGSAVTVDQAGHVYTTGYFEGTADFDPGDGSYFLTADYVDVFISKLDTAGNFLWAKRLGGDIIDYGYYLTTDADTNVYITGRFRGTADFDPGPGVFELTATEGDDAFICKLDVDGNFVWARKLGGTGSVYGYSIDIDSIGNVYTIGHFTETADFNPGDGEFYMTAAGQQDVFISKLDTLGNYVWAKQFKGSRNGSGFAASIDQEGYIYITGHFEGTFDFDPGEDQFLMTAEGEEDIFVCKLDSLGGFEWAIQQGGPETDRAFSLEIDKDGLIYTTGYFSGTADFNPNGDGHLLTALGDVDAFVNKIDNTGKHIWTGHIKAKKAIRSLDLALDSLGNIHTAGYFEDTIYFDTDHEPSTLISAGSNDVFVHKIQRVNVPATFNIVATAGEGGSILPEGESDVEEGEDFVVSVVPDDGYRIAYVNVDGNQIDLSSNENWDPPNSQYVFRNVSSSHTIEAGFEVDDTHAGDIRQQAFRVYPNPAKDQIYIVPNGIHEQSVTFSLLNLQGQTVVQTTFDGLAGHTVHLSLEQIPAGVYLVTLHGSNTNQIMKLVVE